MASSYQSLSADDLLSALDAAGRTPDLDLIRACLERREALTPALLDWLATAADACWPDDDPRWLREIHAGLLLIAFRETAALPIFEEILWDEERENLIDWFQPLLPAYGPVIVPMAARLLADPAAPEYARTVSPSFLEAIAFHYPEERPRVLEILRAQLPPLAADGTVPPSARSHPDMIWVWVASALGDLQDTASRPQVEALFRQGLMDDMVMDLRFYQDLFESDARQPHEATQSYDILQVYEQQHQMVAWETARRQEAGARRLETGTPSQPAPTPVAVAAPAAPRVGRNEPCPCGSGRKYKRCCGRPQSR